MAADASQGMVPLQKLEAFMRLLHALERVERVARIPDSTRLQNTAEHTFELALASWYIASTNKLPLDQGKLFKYALAHDLIEAYAGDSFIYDEKAQQTKAERERHALMRIEKEFSEHQDLIDTMHAYERREDLESKFIYATDKLIDPLNTSLDTERSLWREYGITLEQIHEYKDAKIAQSSHIVPYWQALMRKVAEKKDFFFGA